MIYIDRIEVVNILEATNGNFYTWHTRGIV